MKHPASLLILLLLYLSPVKPQHVLLEKEVPAGMPAVNGPGGKYFNHIYLGTAFALNRSRDEEIAVRYFLSRNATAGWRHLLRAGKLFSVGMGTEYTKIIYDIRQEEGKTFPTEKLHRREMLLLHQAVPEVFFRIKPGKRGDYMGNFIDLGVNGSILLQGKLVVTDHEVPEEYLAERSRTVYNRLRYLESLSYGIFARAGINRIAITAGYRISGTFTKEFEEYPEMPPLFLGVQLGLH